VSRAVLAAVVGVASFGLLARGLAGCHRIDASEQEVDVVINGDDGGGATTEASTEAGLDRGQVDRAGHPLVTVLLVPEPLQDDYNAQSSFDGSLPRTLQDALEARLVAMDVLALGDGGPDPVDWEVPDGGTHPLLPMAVTDVLLVDTARSCASGDGGFAPSYLDLEREIYLGGAAHTTCGGRNPSEDVVDETLTLLVTNGRTPVTQGVTAPAKPSTTTFPYLAEPN
jgi:hypothetical protein